MAYSNTNKDKVQVRLKEMLKNTGIMVILLIIIISAWNNIIQQAEILNEAQKRNQETEQKIKILMEENNKMEKQIQSATDSAYIQRKVREYLGIGKSGDVWLEVDLGTTETKTKEDTVVMGEEPVIKQWWNLFTK